MPRGSREQDSFPPHPLHAPVCATAPRTPRQTPASGRRSEPAGLTVCMGAGRHRYCNACLLRLPSLARPQSPGAGNPLCFAPSGARMPTTCSMLGSAHRPCSSFCHPGPSPQGCSSHLLGNVDRSARLELHCPRLQPPALLQSSGARLPLQRAAKPHGQGLRSGRRARAEQLPGSKVLGAGRQAMAALSAAAAAPHEAGFETEIGWAGGGSKQK